VAEEDQIGVIKAGLPPLMGIEGYVNWYMVLEVLDEIINKSDLEERSMPVSHYISEVIRGRAKSKTNHPPILFTPPPSLDSWNQWMVRIKVWILWSY
jgi:hypothetical protein